MKPSQVLKKQSYLQSTDNDHKEKEVLVASKKLGEALSQVIQKQ